MKIVVAIHGVGNQRICETIRRVASQYGNFCEPGRPVEPLGFFNLAGGIGVALTLVDGDVARQLPPIGVAEVYWADLPRTLARRGDTMDESRAWGRTVAGRAQAAYEYNLRAAGGQQTLKDRHFSRAAGVIEEIVDGVGVMESLTRLAAKAGIFHFELGALLADFVGGIQLPADFQFYRNKILKRFHETLTRAVDRVMVSGGGPPEIYIVAHSEGTVISFAAIMQALLLPQFRPHDCAAEWLTDWVKHLRGYMTIGCPLDKHILLWPALWEQIGLNRPPLQAQLQEEKFATLPQLITWHNYYDYADPIAFDVSEARKYLGYLNCTAFNWIDPAGPQGCADYGFSRYPWPGEAHVAYWDDDDVFKHFFSNVILAGTPPVAPPPTKWSARLLAAFVPYMLAFFVLLLGVASLGSAINDSVSETWYPSLRLPAFLEAMAVLGFTVQLAGLTVAARLPRIGGGWHRPVVLLTALGALFVCWLGAVLLCRAIALQPQSESFACSASAMFLVSLAIVGLSGWVPHGARAGRTWLLGLGAFCVATGLVALLITVGLSKQAPLWRLGLGALAYFYLWWLAIVIFDLSYIWQYYIRHSMAVKTLRTWATGRTWPA
ncbi:MFS transporter [Paraburkholderia sp. BR14263]|uniref:MFS transporter n=1 Tax=unclassified Paraburkholderia TaxID=2615204 RepID=UPI0034CD1410